MCTHSAGLSLNPTTVYASTSTLYAPHESFTQFSGSSAPNSSIIRSPASMSSSSAGSLDDGPAALLDPACPLLDAAALEVLARVHI